MKKPAKIEIGLFNEHINSQFQQKPLKDPNKKYKIGWEDANAEDLVNFLLAKAKDNKIFLKDIKFRSSFVSDSWDDASIYIYANREETEEEYNKRLEEIELAKKEANRIARERTKNKKEEEYKLYLKLKNKFEK